MKITNIEVSNFLGVKAASVRMTTPITLFAGRNYAGKSSLQEAVRMALTGESVRVEHKKDYGTIITDGQEAGFSAVQFDGGEATMVLPSGTHTVNGTLPAALPFVLDAQRFTKLDANERRSFLFGLMGLSVGGQAVKDRLLKRGCDPLKVEAVMPMLRAGFDAAHKEAQAKARDAKSAWRTTTGETYGEKKAATWKASKPEYDAALLKKTRADLVAVEGDIEAAAATLGDLQGRAKRHAEQSARIGDLKEKGARFARIQDKLNHDEAELGAWERKVDETRAKATGKLEGRAPATCPHCQGLVIVDESFDTDEGTSEWVLSAYEAVAAQGDPEAADQLPEYEKALGLMRSSVANGKRDLAVADAAARAMREIEEAGMAEAPDSEEVAAATKHLEDLKHQKTNHEAGIRMAEEAERAATAADAKTTQAATHHAAVSEWEKIADALAPSGIPGDMLSEALTPINERLAQSASDAEWPRVGIESDMSITADSRSYALLSESEKWRVEAMIAEAIGHLSGVKVLVLDRFDVLDPQKGRDDLIAWLDILAQNGELDTALIFGTLKGLPANLPSTFSTHWIESGVIETMKEAA
ncbi:DNA replication and repair protein RecF [mine drainage metagenome]|uniref:DNA replication and repair protein RecF n=1 Tax=mine drainage metagenome TaxID=410659 RepID=A0A1J5S3I8_9ZZZZ